MQAIEAKSSFFLADCANLTVPQLLERFNSSLKGLNNDQLPTLKDEHGLNVLSSAKPPRWWTILFACALNPFNVLLTVLGIISIATRQTATFVILMVMVTLAISLRFWQELKNAIAVTELTKLVHDTVHVVRNGFPIQISKTELRHHPTQRRRYCTSGRSAGFYIGSLCQSIDVDRGKFAGYEATNGRRDAATIDSRLCKHLFLPKHHYEWIGYSNGRCNG